MKSKKYICVLCKERIVKEFYFCEECLSRAKRDETFNRRVEYIKRENLYSRISNKPRMFLK